MTKNAKDPLKFSLDDMVAAVKERLTSDIHEVRILKGEDSAVDAEKAIEHACLLALGKRVMTKPEEGKMLPDPLTFLESRYEELLSKPEENTSMMMTAAHMARKNMEVINGFLDEKLGKSPASAHAR